jgi:hypothetical protein
MTPAPPSIEQRLAEVEATLKVLMKMMVPEFLSEIDTLAQETLPTAVRKIETTVDRADRKLAMEHERLAALEGRVGAIEKALQHLVDKALPAIVSGVETAKNALAEQTAAAIAQSAEQMVAAIEAAIEERSRVLRVLCAELIDKGSLDAADFFALLEREQVAQAEIDALRRMLRREPGGGLG